MITVAGHLLQITIGLTAEGTKGADYKSDYKGDYSHTVTGEGGSILAKIVLGAIALELRVTEKRTVTTTGTVSGGSRVAHFDIDDSKRTGAVKIAED